MLLWKFCYFSKARLKDKKILGVKMVKYLDEILQSHKVIVHKLMHYNVLWESFIVHELMHYKTGYHARVL